MDKNRHKKIKIVLGIFGLFVIPVFSLMYAVKGDLTLVTFSQVAGRYNLQRYLIIWGVLLATFVFVIFNYFFILTQMNSSFIKVLLTTVCTMLIFSVFIPFIPSMFPFISNLHNYLSYATVVFSVLFFYAFVLTLQKMDKKLYKRSLTLLNLVTLITVIFYLIVGTSSIFQLEFSITVCIFLFALLIMIEKSDIVDVELFNNMKINENEKKQNITDK